MHWALRVCIPALLCIEQSESAPPGAGCLSGACLSFLPTVTVCLAVECGKFVPNVKTTAPGSELSVAAAEKPPKTKRPIAQPRDGFMIENVTAQTVTPIPYDIVKEGIQT